MSAVGATIVIDFAGAADMDGFDGHLEGMVETIRLGMRAQLLALDMHDL